MRVAISRAKPIRKIFLAAFIGGYAATALADLKHRFSFNDGTISDLVGSATGTLNNGATISNGWLVFHNDGISSNIATGQYATLSTNVLNYRNFTLETWFTFHGGANWQRMVDFGNNTMSGQDVLGRGYIILTLNGCNYPLGEVSLDGWGGSRNTDYVYSPTNTFPLDGEHQLVYSHDVDGGQERLFLDGVLIGVSTARVDVTTVVYTNLWLGRSQFAHDPFFNGSIDELRTYDVPLTDSQILRNFIAGPDTLPVIAPLFTYCTNNGAIVITGYSEVTPAMTIPDQIDGMPVVSIADTAFRGATIIKMTLPDSLTNIGVSAFQNCSRLQSMVIPDGVTQLGNFAFAGCSSLTNIILSNGVVSLGGHAFEGCPLKNVVIPSGVTQIGDFAFAGCSSLTNLVLSNGVVSLGSHAFERCPLQHVAIPASITNIGDACFAYCKLRDMMIPEGVTSLGNALFEGCDLLSNVTICAPISMINHGMFAYCISLSRLILPERVTSIGDNAFRSCAFRSFVCSNSITNIGCQAFMGCDNLYSISLPTNLARIGSNAFEGCSALCGVIIPVGVTTLEDSAFKNCVQLSIVNCLGSAPGDGSDTSVFSGDENATIYFHAGKTGWSALFDGRPAILHSGISTVSVNSSPSAGGSVSGGGDFAPGSSIVITATRATNCVFMGWNDGVWSNPRTIMVPPTNINYSANFLLPVTLTLLVNTNEGGSVRGGGECPAWSQQLIRAEASNGWLFACWSDDVGINPREILIPDSNVTYTAIFGEELTITAQANPLDAGRVFSSSSSYPRGVPLMLVAQANAQWAFSYWSCGWVTNTDNPLVIMATSNATWTANFVQQANVTVTANPIGGGVVSGGGTYLTDSTVTLTATASNSWLFTQWNDGNSENPRIISVPPSNINYTANFAPVVTITVGANTNAGGSVSGSGTYFVGSNVTLTAAASNGWVFAGWADGIITNPRHITVTPSSAIYTAIFVASTINQVLGGALNATNLVWNTGGNSCWKLQTATTRDGAAAQSGAISAGQQSWLQTTTNGPGSLLFWWKVTSTTTNQLQFFIGTQLVSQISGNIGWNQYITFIGTSNPVTLKWVYTKNSATVFGSDAGFVDQVTWLPCPNAQNVPQLFFQEPSGTIASWVIGSTGSFQFARILANTGGWALKTAGDIDGDGVSDLLFQNSASDTGGWFLNADGSTRDARFWFNIGSWEIKAAGDYEGIGRAQLLFQNTAGTVAYWRLDTNGAFQSAVVLGNMPGWKLRGAGDLDGDHKAELFWQNAAGQVAIWWHDGPGGTIRGLIAFSTGEWALSGVIDVDNDGVCDLIWQTPDTRTGGWFMQTNGTARSASFWWPTGGWKLKAAGR